LVAVGDGDDAAAGGRGGENNAGVGVEIDAARRDGDGGGGGARAGQSAVKGKNADGGAGGVGGIDEVNPLVSGVDGHHAGAADSASGGGGVGAGGDVGDEVAVLVELEQSGGLVLPGVIDAETAGEVDAAVFVGLDGGGAVNGGGFLGVVETADVRWGDGGDGAGGEVDFDDVVGETADAEVAGG